MFHRAALLATVTAACLLSACVQPQRVPTTAVGNSAGCNAQAAQFAIGYSQTDALAEEVRYRSGARLVRVLRPDTVTTMEYSEQRINLEVDAGNRVTRVRCG